MLPTLPFCHAVRRRGCLLLMALLFFVVATNAQSLTPEALRDVRTQLDGKLADTARVRLLLVVSGHAAAHVARSTARDSALRFAQNAMVLSARMGYDSGVYKAHLKEIALWVNVRDWQLGEKQDDATALESKRAAQARFITFVHKNGSPDQLGEAYLDMVDLYEETRDYAEGLLLCDSAAAWFRRSGNTAREAYAVYATAVYYNLVGKQKESLPLYHRSIALAESTGGSLVYRIYTDAAKTYNVLGGYNTALKYGLRALQLAEAAGDTTDLPGEIHLFLGITYVRLGNDAVALDHYQKAYRIEQRYCRLHPGVFLAAAVNVASILVKTNPSGAIDFLTRFKADYADILNRVPSYAMALTMRFMDAYANLHDFARAQSYCDVLMADVKTIANPLVIYIGISKFLVLSKQYRLAEDYLTLAERLSKEQGAISTLPNIYLYWHKVDSAQRDCAGAMEKFKLHKAYSDSVLNEAKAKEIALLEIEYETAKKEQSIALLTKDSELGRQQLAQSRFEKNAFLTGLVVAVLILGLLFNQYRIKKRSNLELTRQKQEIECRQKEIESTNALLHKTILEKEWLLKEVHHRVKNNLQTVVSLLGSQSYALQNHEAASAIQDSQNRVHAMSLIHQKLYLTEHRTSVNMAGYLNELVDYLRDSFSTGRRIHVSLDIQPIELDVSQAIPIGLVLNEAVTNAIKYAFSFGPDDGSRVVVAMHQDAERNVRLTISDNGNGLPPDFDYAGGSFGMGLRLMQGLMSEIDGWFRISSEGVGVEVEVGFRASVLLD